MLWSIGILFGLFFSVDLCEANSELSTYLRMGDCHGALEVDLSNESNLDDVFRVALGRCLLKTQKPQQALEMLEGVSADYVSQQKTLYMVQSYEQLAEIQKALEILSSQDASDPTLQLMLAKLLLSKEEYIQARDVLRPLLKHKRSNRGYIPSAGEIDPAEVRWLLAEGAIKRGLINGAKQMWWNIWMYNPTSKFSKEAVIQLIKYGESVPNPNTEQGINYIRERAVTFSKMYMYKEALTLTNLLEKKEGIHYSKKRAYDNFKAKNYSVCVDIFDNLSELNGEDLYHYALASVRTGDYNKSREIYKKLYTKYPTHKRASTASYKIGYMYYDESNYQQAVIDLPKHLERYPKSSLNAQARWFTAWSYVQLKDDEKAVQALEQFVELHSKDPLAAIAYFWLGKISEKSGETELQQKYFNLILTKYPNSDAAWYVSLYQEISFPSSEKISMNSFSTIPAKLDIPAVHQAQKLAAAGFEVQARAQLKKLIPTVKSDKKAALYLAHQLIYAGDFISAQKLARPYCSWKKPDPVAIQACYPRPYSDIVESRLRDHSLPKNLPYAIMTAESGLKPWVTSPASARGLMQLMPKVGETLHQDHFQAPYDAIDLYQGGYNAFLGTTELMRLYNIYTPSPLQDEQIPLPLVIAGYNAGSEAVNRWMSDFQNPPTADTFGALVGYIETRKYVQRVLGYMMKYNWIYGN